MIKHHIAKGLLATVLCTQFFSSTVMASGVTVPTSKAIKSIGLDCTETVKLYRKTSKSPGEENKKFRIAFHTNEPLGLEVLGETQIEVLIEGEGISGSANLNLHDVDNLRSIQKVTVGEITAVTLPRKGQLFLDVSNVKFKQDLNADFEINVTIRLNGESYKVTPTYDIRDEKISENAMENEDEFEAAVLSNANKEDGALLIGENVRIYVPKSKYVPTDFDASDVIDNHEEIISTYNTLAGSTDEDEDSINAPRQNFVLVSARNQQGGYMSAGGTMLDTLPQSIHEYFKDEWTQDVWGMYHEYGHMYEQGWGYVEYWNNIFANQLRRKVFGPQWAWIHGNNEATYEANTVLPAYQTYLTTGEKKSIHPMYYFLSFIDHYDKDFMANISTYYREHSISYGYVDYVIYYAAANYGINIIPYMEASGHAITNTELIKDVLNLATSTYMYMPEGAGFADVKQTSYPATVNSIYTGAGRVLTGMSNPNAEVTVTVDGKETTMTADENGKFQIAIEEVIKLDSKITVVSKEQGKKASFARNVTVLNHYNSLDFRGYSSATILDVALDPETSTFVATSTGKVANIYSYASPYFSLTHFDKRGNELGSYKVAYNQTADAVAEKLNGVTFKEGDYLVLHHAEKGRLCVTGEVLDAPYALSTGAANLNLTKSYFYIKNNQLQYSETRIQFPYDRDDLANEIQKADALVEADYTKSSWSEYHAVVEAAREVMEAAAATEAEVIKATTELVEAGTVLKKVNKILFKGYASETFLTLGFDSETKTLTAVSNGKTIHSYIGNKLYASVEHYSKKGVLKGSYQVKGNETADSIAKKLNGFAYETGDYLKLSHTEQNARLALTGYIKNMNQDCSDGVGTLNLNESYFYLTGENFEYATEVLDLSADKTVLAQYVEQYKKASYQLFTTESTNAFMKIVTSCEDFLAQKSVTQEEIDAQIERLFEGVMNLQQLTQVQVRGDKNDVVMMFGIEKGSDTVWAKSYSRTANKAYGDKVYVIIMQYNYKGEVKNRYEIAGNATADAVAKKMNGTKVAKGDYFMFNHADGNKKLLIFGQVENAPVDFAQGMQNVSSETSYFYVVGDILSYSNELVDYSADKTSLHAAIKEAEDMLANADAYTASTKQAVTDAVNQAKELAATKNVEAAEITDMVQTLTNAVQGLREKNSVLFKGYGNQVFLSVSFDTENQVIYAISTGIIANAYQYGREYVVIEHHSADGTLLATYSMKANQTADAFAGQLDGTTFEKGDYLTLFHLEQHSRLQITGYIENAGDGYSNGVGSLNLAASKFVLGEENLSLIK